MPTLRATCPEVQYTQHLKRQSTEVPNNSVDPNSAVYFHVPGDNVFSSTGVTAGELQRVVDQQDPHNLAALIVKMCNAMRNRDASIGPDSFTNAIYLLLPGLDENGLHRFLQLPQELECPALQPVLSLIPEINANNFFSPINALLAHEKQSLKKPVGIVANIGSLIGATA